MTAGEKQPSEPVVLIDTPLWKEYFRREERVFPLINALMDAGRVCSLTFIIAELVAEAAHGRGKKGLSGLSPDLPDSGGARKCLDSGGRLGSKTAKKRAEGRPPGRLCRLDGQDARRASSGLGIRFFHPRGEPPLPGLKIFVEPGSSKMTGFRKERKAERNWRAFQQARSSVTETRRRRTRGFRILILMIAVLVVSGSVLYAAKGNPFSPWNGPVQPREADPQPEPAFHPPVNGTPPNFANTIEGKFYEDRDGHRLLYTVDPALQKRVQEVFRKHRPPYSVFVALDPQSGKILCSDRVCPGPLRSGRHLAARHLSGRLGFQTRDRGRGPGKGVAELRLPRFIPREPVPPRTAEAERKRPERPAHPV